MKIKNNDIGAVLVFLENAIIIEEREYVQDIIEDYDNISAALRSKEFDEYLLDRRALYSIMVKCIEKCIGKDEYGNEEFEGEIDLTLQEVKVLESFIFCYFLDYIRKDSDVDNLNWVKCILDINAQCKKEIEKSRKNKKKEN